MTQPATCISTCARSLFLSGVCAFVLAAPPAAFAQPQDDPDVRDVARTPLTDLNIDPDEIPEVLVEAAADPYAAEGLVTCNAIVAEVARLDTVLGEDFDLANDREARRISEGRVAQSVIGSFIPFRGIVREVSGANKRRAEVARAVTAGMVRRGFLKGLGQQRGCDYPARPNEDRGSESDQ